MPKFADGIVIVGASAAGLSAADGLREGGYAGPITVVDAEIAPGYDRPMLSKGLLATKEHAVPRALRSSEQLQEKRIEVLAGHAAMGLDIDRRLVVTNWGEAIPWQQLVIASGVGARPLRTTGGQPVATLRTRADLAQVREMAGSGRPVTLIGAGFIGLEVAAALRSRDVDVRVLSRLDLPLSHLVGADVATWLYDMHVHHGVSFETGLAEITVSGSAGDYLIQLPGGRGLQAEQILAGIGTAPNTDWLIGSGVELNCGVVTDDAGRTNVPGIWAAGDVASMPRGELGHRRYEHWTNAIEQGRHVGLNMARGQAEPYACVPYLWTEQYGRTVHLLGERISGDEDVLLEGEVAAGEFVVAHGRGGELHAITTSGLPRALRTYKKLLRSGASMEEAHGAAEVTTPAT